MTSDSSTSFRTYLSKSKLLMSLMVVVVQILLVVLPTNTAAAKTTHQVHIYASLLDHSNNAVARKQQQDFLECTDRNRIQMHYRTHAEQRDYIQENCNNDERMITIWEKWENAVHLRNLQTELYKWCALAQGTAKENSNDIAIWLDSESPILTVSDIQAMWTDTGTTNVAVLDSSSNPLVAAVHGSYLQLQGKHGRNVALKMLEWIQQPNVHLILPSHAMLLPYQLYTFIAQERSTKAAEWTFLQLKCRHSIDVDGHLQCGAGYCCSIQNQDTTILMSRYFVIPHQTLPGAHYLPKPYNADHQVDPFISTIAVQSFEKTLTNTTPNFYDILVEQNCLPEDEVCSKCLHEKKGSDCHTTCVEACPCFCQKLCHTDIPTKHLAQEWTVTPPSYNQDPTRLIPRLVHQTWFDDSIQDNHENRYPNMSRMVQSFAKSGWEYRFWSDERAMTFLEEHFPPAVLEAYQALKPGAFKADLFRYCVLLIMGGVYADVDIQLESILDFSVPSDVGFMVPVDEPGKPVHKQMCVWNGFIAAAPGHPFLAKAIETVVNQVRNRFTSVDIDATFCPNPELSLLHAFDTLFTAGPCLLGSSINRVLGRNAQASHIPGELHGLWSDEQRALTLEGTSFVITDHESQLEHRIPGRTIILHQNKWDMGAHRFTFLEQNLVVAATDLPNSNDRENLQDEVAHDHYSKTHAKIGIYGVEHLYEDEERADEMIRIVVDATMLARKQSADVS